MAPVPACICADTLSACPWSESKAPVERPSATAPLPGMIIARATIMAASCARHFLVRSFIVFLLVDVSRPVQSGPLPGRSEEHTSELQSGGHIVCRLLLEKKDKCRITRETIMCSSSLSYIYY